MDSQDDMNCVMAVKSAVISCLKTAPYTSSITRTQTEDSFGGAAMNRVSIPSFTMPKLAPHVRNRLRAGAVVRDQLPACVRPALEASVEHYRQADDL